MITHYIIKTQNICKPRTDSIEIVHGRKADGHLTDGLMSERTLHGQKDILPNEYMVVRLSKDRLARSCWIRWGWVTSLMIFCLAKCMLAFRPYLPGGHMAPGVNKNVCNFLH